MHWCLRKGEGKKIERVVFVILSCYFLAVLLFTTFSCKACSWRELLTFQECRAGPSGGRFWELFVCDCLQLSVREKKEGKGGFRGGGEMEMEERKDSAVFDQRGAESHWDVMERLVLCDTWEGTGRTWGRQYSRLNERFEKSQWSPSVFKVSFTRAVANAQYLTSPLSSVPLSPPSLCLSLSLRGVSLWASV